MTTVREHEMTTTTQDRAMSPGATDRRLRNLHGLSDLFDRRPELADVNTAAELLAEQTTWAV